MSSGVQAIILTDDPAGCMNLSSTLTFYSLDCCQGAMRSIRRTQHRAHHPHPSGSSWPQAGRSGQLLLLLRCFSTHVLFSLNVHILLLYLVHSYWLFRIQLKHYFLQEAFPGCADEVRAESCSLLCVCPQLFMEQISHLSFTTVSSAPASSTAQGITRAQQISIK